MIKLLNYQDIIYNLNINAGATVTIPWGGNGSATTWYRVADYTFLTYGFQSDQPCTLKIYGHTQVNVATPIILVTHAAAAATYTTPYLLPAPMSYDGFIILTQPFIRIDMTNTSGSNTTSFNFYCKVWV